MKILSNLPDTDAGTTERPDGAVKDVSSPGAGDGTPFRADWHNDHYYALLALMDAVGIAADDSDEEFEAGTGSSQFLSAMRLFVQEWAYPGLDFGLQNISGGNQTSDITIYESGGGSEKEDGFTVRLHWTGGDGTFNHSITSAYTIGNELVGFLASSAWQGDGAGELVLRLDKTNSKWLVLTPMIWDSGEVSNIHFIKMGNGTVTHRGAETTDGSGIIADITFAIVHIGDLPRINSSLNETGAFNGSFSSIYNVTLTEFDVKALNHAGTPTVGVIVGWRSEGRWI